MKNKIKILSALFAILICISGEVLAQSMEDRQPNITIMKGSDDNSLLEAEDIDVIDMKTLCQRNNIDIEKLTTSETNYQFWVRKKDEEGFNSRLYRGLIIEHLAEIKNQINQK